MTMDNAIMGDTNFQLENFRRPKDAKLWGYGASALRLPGCRYGNLAAESGQIEFVQGVLQFRSIK